MNRLLSAALAWGCAALAALPASAGELERGVSLEPPPAAVAPASGILPPAAMPSISPVAALTAAPAAGAAPAASPAEARAAVVSAPLNAVRMAETSGADVAGALSAAMDGAALSTVEKTRAFNASKTAAGTFAEIGAGQNVAGYFYQGKQAANTVITSISAYGKDSSTDRYGPAERFVSEQRLNQMLDKESSELARVSAAGRPDSPLFAFANTVTTKKGGRGQGWVGLAFQQKPGGPWSRVLLHVNLLDQEVLDQHDALGVLGVNIVHGAYRAAGRKEGFVAVLGDNLSPRRVEIDSIRFEGEGLSGVDDRLVGLQLLQSGLAKALLYDPQGRMAPVYESTWGKPLLAYFPGAKERISRILDRFKTQPGVDPSKLIAMEVVDLKSFTGRDGRLDAPAFLKTASDPNYVLMTRALDAEGLKSLMLRLNAGVKGAALPRPSGKDSDVETIADGSAAPRPPLTVYYYGE